MIFSKASLPVWFRNLLDHPPTWPESETHMILQMQAKVHGLGNLGVLTYTYPILSWFEATFCLISPHDEVDHDKIWGRSSRVFLKFGRRHPNLTKLLCP